MQYYTIYKIVNDIYPEIYVGCTKQSLNRRWSGHKDDTKRRPDQKIYNYVREIGVNNFRIELLEVRECSKSQARELEQKWIDQLNPMLNMVGAIQKIYQCDECDFQSSREMDLIRHIRIHTGEQPFACEQCDKRFNRKCSLTRHIRSKH